MIRQYEAGRHRVETIRGRLRRVGTQPAGTICRLPGGRVIIEGWIPRDYQLCEGRGRWRTVRIRGGHLAQVRFLATGRRALIADHHLLDKEDAA